MISKNDIGKVKKYLVKKMPITIICDKLQLQRKFVIEVYKKWNKNKDLK
jgi:hypothetical protein